MGGFIRNQNSSTKLYKKLDDLQQLVGDAPKIQISSFKNWEENIIYEKILSCRPKKLAEIQVSDLSLTRFFG